MSARPKPAVRLSPNAMIFGRLPETCGVLSGRFAFWLLNFADPDVPHPRQRAAKKVKLTISGIRIIEFMSKKLYAGGESFDAGILELVREIFANPRRSRIIWAAADVRLYQTRDGSVRK